MQPLNLTLGPPRAPREELDGLIFLPRSIDKVRATLPGGEPGAYRIEGLTATMLDTLGVSLEVFTLAVGAANDDDEVAAVLRSYAQPDAYATWNAFVGARKPRGGNRAEARAVYPWLKDDEELPLVLDVLEQDDKRSFTVTNPAGR